MARFLFLENREKTELWAAVAAQLQTRGHDIHWLVQNPAFRPKTDGSVTIIPFPGPKEYHEVADSAASFPILTTDRGREYFDAGSAHYRHYQNWIESMVARVQPSVIIGECTLFHELLLISAARSAGIPFLHPAGERYQNDRFHLFCDETQEIFCDGPDIMAKQAAEALAEAIIGDTARPKYMIGRTGLAKQLHRLKWAWTRGKVWLAGFRGERFNTPSLATKIRLSRHRNANLALWKKLASQPKPGEISVLYPMQMQPEANIDVWGRPFNDQVAVIRRLADAMPAGGSVAVKANPKIKYEISHALVALAESREDIKLLPIDMPMAAARKATIGAVTVSGTVGHEAVFGLGRCISLRHPVLSRHFPKFVADTPEEAVRKLLNDHSAGKGSKEEGAELIRQLYNGSFRGFISDPLTFPSVLDKDNVIDIANGLEAALEHITPPSRAN